MNISNHKNIILTIVAVLLIFFGYWFFFLSKKDASNTANTSLTTESPVASNTQYDKEFVGSLLGLNSVNLDVRIFESKVYQALSYPQVPFVVNYSRESGRENPFLPIGVDPVSVQNVQNQTNVNQVSPEPSKNQPSAPATTTSTTPAPTPKKF